MASIRHFPFLHFTFAFAFATVSGHALQIGETQAQIVARHGAPAVEDHARRLAVYFWEGWSAQVEFTAGADGTVGKLTYRSNGYLADAEIQSLLQANGGVNRWRETTSLGTQARRWVRDDGAVATGDAARPTGMIFQVGDAAPEALSPAETIVSDSFLKFDAAASVPAPQPVPAASQREPVVRSNAQLPRLRSEPGLRDDDPVLNAAPPEPPANAAPLELPAPVVAAAPVVERAVSSGGIGRTFAAILFGLGLAAAAFFLFLAKRKPARSTASAEPGLEQSAAPAEPAAAGLDPADLDSLRGDQIELLLGEIFRRQGYTIELSAALDSDLMLRRDGESIPVHTGDWKTARITEKEVREFYGLMASTAAPRGVMVTTGSFSRDAREFADGKSIDLIDRHGLSQRIEAVRRPEENFFAVAGWIDDFAAQARIFDPECPICRGAMAIRMNRSSGASAWACIGSPRCAGKRDPRADLLTLPVAA